ncbi:MAG TPA: hypothetical protein VH087_10515 [Thermoanaerobaculia bacterium]|jgi:hypothetical protein|nr:hypothetical protein [Thermoanaerobaculia bacterium]
MPYESLLYVDRVGSNYLYRGPEPILDGQFDYAGLTVAIDSQPIAPPLPYYLVEVSLLHMIEVSELTPSLEFWQNNQNLGQVVLWDTYGTSQCVFQTPSPQRETLIETLDEWLPDPLIWRVATLRNWLQGTPLPIPQPIPGQPLVIYVHCDGGCDRTGEMIGAYMLHYLCAWQEMWSTQPCGRPMGCNNYRAVEWYAFWLNATQGFSLTGIGDDGGCYDSIGVHKACPPD